MILLEEIEKVEFLPHFTAAHLRRIAQVAQLRECKAGDMIFHEGERDSYVYLVLEGEVGLEFRVSGLGAVQALTVGPGELLGWSSLLGGAPMTATARAETRCRLAALCAAQLRTLTEQDTKFGMEFFRAAAAALAQRLYAARVEIPHAANGRGRIHCEAAD